MGGETDPGAHPTNCESFNGTNWTQVNDINTARIALSGTGTDNTAALISGGRNPPTNYANTESWNGSNWTEVADLNTTRYALGGAGNSNTAAISFGGLTPPRTAASEQWNGAGPVTITFTDS